MKKLKELKEVYKKVFEIRLRENQMKGIVLIIDQVLDELFDEIAIIIDGMRHKE